MDTREKILTLETAARNPLGPLTVVVGHFDPMTAAHARRVHELRRADRRILAIVTDPPDAILSQRARAELTAALEDVDYVVAAMENTSAEIIARLRPDEVIQEEAADLSRAQELRARVRARQIAREP